MIEQQRKEAFAKAYNEVVQDLVKQYGCQVIPSVQAEVLGETMLNRAILKIVLVEDWQPEPQAMIVDEAADPNGKVRAKS